MTGEAKHAGGCVCGAVRFLASGEPRRVTVCHCLWCQRRTGSAFGVEAVFGQAQVEFQGEAAARYRHVSDESGRWLETEFCPRCGTNLGMTLEAPCRRAHSTIPAGSRPNATNSATSSSARSAAGTAAVGVYEQHFRK